MLGITIDVVSFLSTAFYNLSKYEDKSGRPSFNPFLFLQSLTTAKGLLDSSMGSPCITCQWSNTHWGKAWPPVFDLKSAVKPGKIIKNMKNHEFLKKTFQLKKVQIQTSKNHQWLKNLRWKPRMVWKTRISSLKITSEIKKMRTYRKIRWQASKPWRGTWEFREPGSLRTRVHDDDWAHHKFHRQRFQGTIKILSSN